MSNERYDNSYRQSRLVPNLAARLNTDTSGNTGDDGGGIESPDRELAEPNHDSSTSGNQPEVANDRGEAGDTTSRATNVNQPNRSSSQVRNSNPSSTSGRGRGATRGRGSNSSRSGKTPRATTASTKGQQPTDEDVFREVKGPRVINFDDAKSAKDWSVNLTEFAKIIETGSTVIAQFAGAHWEFTANESQKLAKAIKELPATKNSWLMKFLAKNQPWINLIMVGGAIFVPRAVISYQMSVVGATPYEQPVYTQQPTHSQESQEFSPEQPGQPGQDWSPNSNAWFAQSLHYRAG